MRTQVLDWLSTQVPPKRLQHILGVEGTARQLAECHGLDPHQAARAGLLHDLAKCFTSEQLLTAAQRYQIPLDPITEHNPHLLHAPVSAHLAQELFGENDSHVLAAIANHTLGAPQMDALSCVVYLADWIEPNRTGEEILSLRTLAFDNLRQGVLLGCNLAIADLLAHGRPIHPQTVLTRNGFLFT